MVGEFDPVRALRTLAAHDVEFIVIGGVAARLRGAPLLTEDVDVAPARDAANLARLADALSELGAALRTPHDEGGVPVPVEPDMLATAESWTLVTTAGPLDLVFVPAGSEGYDDLARDAEWLLVAVDPELRVLVASLRDVIRTKEATGRAKDRAALPMLRATLEEIRAEEGS